MSANTSWPTVPCDHGWEYDLDNFHSSITSDNDWVCDRAWIPPLSQTLFFVGNIPGTLFFGWFSDHYGRVPAIFFSNGICLVTGVLIPLFPSMVPFLILRFTQGLSYSASFFIVYILGKDNGVGADL